MLLGVPDQFRSRAGIPFAGCHHEGAEERDVTEDFEADEAGGSVRGAGEEEVAAVRLGEVFGWKIGRGEQRPDGVETGVVPLRFSATVKGLDGGPPVVIETPKQYETYIKDNLFSYDRGWTHFYEAVDYSLRGLMLEKPLTDCLAIHSGEPTIVALTDGFTNHSGADTCSTNVTRLQFTL